MHTRAIKECGFLRLDGRRKAPLFRQLYEQIRLAILQGELKTNDRIPSSRDLTHQLGVSRTTVVTALDMLISEGYLATRPGTGTFVASDIPDQQVATNHGQTPSGTQSAGAIELSHFGKFVAKSDRNSLYRGRPAPLCPGEPALDMFPSRIWSKIVRRVWKSVSPTELSYGEPSGYFPLRRQIAEYLGARRGVSCKPSQVMIVSGTQQAIDVCARLFLKTNDQVLVENPGYISAREAFEKHLVKVASLPVDQYGADISQVSTRGRNSKLVYVTPSHQFPLGITMSIERRLELIQWAQQSNAVILEDDYDSEFRYGQKPLPCLQGLDQSARTIYVGSFSKVICPGLGIGFAIVPASVERAFESALRLSGRPPSQIDQIVLSEFIREGHFVRHIRRMRKTHGERRQQLVDALRKKLSEKLDVVGSPAGLHCTALFKNKQTNDRNIVDRLAEAKVIARALSTYYAQGTALSDIRTGLVLGFASSSPVQIRRAISSLATTLTSYTTT